MIDIGKILKRAWNILWEYRTLWLLGLILAITTASATSRGSSSLWREEARDWQPGRTFHLPNSSDIREAWEQMRLEINREIPWERISPDEWSTILWVIFGLVILLIVIGLVMMVARFVSETAVIRMVDEYEHTGQKVKLRQGLRYGWSRTAWRLFLINLLVVLPVIILVISGLLIGVGIFFLVSAGSSFFSTTGIITLIGLFFLLLFMSIILGVGMMLLRDIFWRVCVLEGVGVRDALRLGWDMVRQNWKSVGLTWLVMIAVRIVWAFALVLIVIITLPLLVITAAAGLVVGGLPALLVGGLSSLFLGGPLPWIIGAVVGLPFFMFVTFSPAIFIRGMELVYNSTVWTLTYRELKALTNLAERDKVPQVEIERIEKGEEVDET